MSDKLPGSFEGDTFCRQQIGVDGIVHGYRILLRSPWMPPQSKGGIIIPPASREARQNRANIGLVLSMGPKCFVGKDYDEADKNRCAVGDWVWYSSYEKEECNKNEFLCYYINDDRVYETIKPEDLSTILGDRL